MDSQKSQGKLTRTQSSLLRSSPTIRSSIHSLNSINELGVDHEPDLEEQKPHKPGSIPVRPAPSRIAPILAILAVSTYTLFVFFNRDDIPTSENLLLALIFVAVLLFLAGKKKQSIHQGYIFFKHLSEEYGKKLGLSGNQSKPVKWFIGETNKEGNFEKVNREGVEVYSNGDFYEGEYHKGKCNGSGVYNYFVHGRYEGDWVDGKYDGYGIESWARGSKYRGQYRQGLRHGYGVYKFYTGDTYAGEWCNGQSHGIGSQSCSDGSCYVGQFKRAVKHGLGCYHFRNGDRYAGEYFGDKIHGFGVYHFANGHCYEGSWHEGRKQGYGMYTFRNGDTRCGEWDSGNLKTPLPPLTHAVLRAVQAARKAAENAIKLRRVDEQVNKAVMAANRAATAARVAAIKAVQNQMDGKFCDTNYY
ncbi:PREDICTED: uncharacterized protein LOC109210325 [Nicotiana attenuata]|uniref:Phosphatidylinositol 4-phosphate 5-kinase 1 n=1 Tax=Nicotiana attenuata TaxID=49451 RepID=A0A314KLN8_NICAT|nr:PREDICTED: uncharacterized protein LOC109210325 [Nicotiana attenuata]OIT30200.1 phosphatidylinositol 4-phosphate 5-kinase 1 [Nicotiana attenuata]